MKFLCHIIKFVVISGLVFQLMVAAFMTSMVLDRSVLKAAQNNFYVAFSHKDNDGASKNAFSLCLTDDSETGVLKDCFICDALVGADFYTLPDISPFSLPLPVASHPVVATFTPYTQRSYATRMIRGPPVFTL